MKNIPDSVLFDLVTYNHTGDLPSTVALSRMAGGLSSRNRSRSWHTTDAIAAKNDVLAFLRARGYYTAPVGRDLFAVLEREGDDYVTSIVEVDTMKNNINIGVTGDADEVEFIQGWFDEKYSSKGALISTITGFSPNGAMLAKEEFLPDHLSATAIQSFYPWLSISLAEYFDAFMKSDESVLILFGEPGTGKSTFLRSLICHGHYKAYLAYAKEVVESSAIIDKFTGGNFNILAYEDVDKYLKPRDDGNTLMSSILNASEGVIRHPGKKIVFSTNLTSINKIDPALMRVGRCFDILEFKELTVDQSKQVLTDMNYPMKDLSSKDKWPLAEVLSKHNPAQQVVNRFSKKIGF